MIPLSDETVQIVEILIDREGFSLPSSTYTMYIQNTFLPAGRVSVEQWFSVEGGFASVRGHLAMSGDTWLSQLGMYYYHLGQKTRMVLNTL